MRTSETGLGLIKKHEGLRLAPYKCPAGLWTIGYGHLILPGENFGGPITQEEASGLLRKDIETAETAIVKNVLVPLKQNRFDALVSLVFNIGAAAFRDSTILRYVNNPDFKSGKYPTMGSAWLAWNKAGGKELPGLTLRRTDEWNLYQKC
ncbi:MAG: lysozyme [Rickettsiales bacterium]|jgi:lysozyme|nr:lysozyme [Rickettsiales bacterium]